MCDISCDLLPVFLVEKLEPGYKAVYSYARGVRTRRTFHSPINYNFSNHLLRGVGCLGLLNLRDTLGK